MTRRKDALYGALLLGGATLAGLVGLWLTGNALAGYGAFFIAGMILGATLPWETVEA